MPAYISPVKNVYHDNMKVLYASSQGITIFTWHFIHIVCTLSMDYFSSFVCTGAYL